MSETQVKEDFQIGTFEYQGREHKIVLTQETAKDEYHGQLCWTECYKGILIHPEHGTVTFTVFPRPHDQGRWCTDNELIDEGITEIISNLIEEKFDDPGTFF